MKYKGWIVIGVLVMFLLPLTCVSDIYAGKKKRSATPSAVKSSGKPASTGHASVARSTGRGSYRSSLKQYRGYGGQGRYRGYGYYSYYPWGYYPWYNPWFYWGPFYHHSYYYPVTGDYYYSGKVKTKIKPDSARVYVNGYLVGTADDFNGPFQYLHLKPGEYRMTFREKGYAPYMADVFVRPGHTTKVKFRLEEGADIIPEGVDLAILPPEEAESGSDDIARGEAESGAEEKTGSATHYLDSGRLILTLQPVDASIYIDGQFWGSLENARNRLGVIRLEPGDHVLEITRPGYLSIKRGVTVEKDRDLALNISLEAEPESFSTEP